ncbi:MAG: CBS domain-containing protein [Saprospirales bacterium]|nr:CBS domain-containing protein [Saprospirales bacterium]
MALAREGGLGLAQNMSIDAQAQEVRKVKRSESGMITDPITLKPTAKVAEAFALMSEKMNWGIPITNESGILVGILTNHDLRFCKDKNIADSGFNDERRLITAPEKQPYNKPKIFCMNTELRNCLL